MVLVPLEPILASIMPIDSHLRHLSMSIRAIHTIELHIIKILLADIRQL